jgi:tripartite-type tricarboxylate transporter receptor subunit TctC
MLSTITLDTARAMVSMVPPAGTPRDIVRRLNEETVKAAQSPEMSDRLRSEGSEVRVSTPEEMEKIMASELAKWARVVREAGIAEAR